jgi:hypothetical protein
MVSFLLAEIVMSDKYFKLGIENRRHEDLCAGKTQRLIRRL